MLLTTQRLALREWEPSMAADLCALSQDPENRRFLPDEVFETSAEAEETIASLLQNRKTGEGPQVLAVLQKDGPLVGHVELCPLEGTEDWEVGYHIGAPWRGRGYAAEALGAFLPAMLPEMGLTMVYGICREDNVPSRRVMEKCGFSLALRRRAVIYGQAAVLLKYRYLLPEKTHF